MIILILLDAIEIIRVATVSNILGFKELTSKRSLALLNIIV